MSKEFLLKNFWKTILSFMLFDDNSSKLPRISLFMTGICIFIALSSSSSSSVLLLTLELPRGQFQLHALSLTRCKSLIRYNSQFSRVKESNELSQITISYLIPILRWREISKSLHVQKKVRRKKVLSKHTFMVSLLVW